MRKEDISESLALSIIENRKRTVSLMGIKIKVGWVKACTIERIGDDEFVRTQLKMISSQEFFARACSALILNDIFLLYTLYHILWRVLFLVPQYELVHFMVSYFDMEFMNEYKEEGFLNFLNNPELEWLKKDVLGFANTI